MRTEHPSIGVVRIVAITATISLAAALTALMLYPRASSSNSPGNSGAWCDGPGFYGAADAGSLLLGMGEYSEGQREAAQADPLWPVACGLAAYLWQLTPDQEVWCADTQNRQALVEPAIQLLGFGARESSGNDLFGEAPGDNPAEYVQACRYAHDLRIGQSLPPLTAPAAQEFTALEPSAKSWCESHTSELESTAERMGEVADASRQFAWTHICRIALKVESARAVVRVSPPSVTPQPEPIVIRIVYVNQSATDVRIGEAAEGMTSDGLVPACSVVEGVRGLDTLPIELRYGSTSVDVNGLAAFHTIAQTAPADQLPAGVEVRFVAGSSPQVREIDGDYVAPSSGC